MNTVEKALVTRDLSKASAALKNAFAVAANSGNLDLAKQLREQQKALAEQITTLNGGPIKLTATDLRLGT